MNDPFNGEKWNPSGRYLVTAAVGDGGEMEAAAYPECILGPDEELVCTDHCWTGWVMSHNGTAPALTEGIRQATVYFVERHPR